MFATALAALIVTGLPAQADNASQDVATLRAELLAGTLLTTHGVRATCAGCQADLVTTAPGSTTALSTGAPVGLGADDLARAYHLPPAGIGVRGTVGIIDAGAYPTLEQDLAVYRRQYHLPPCTTADGCLRITDINGGSPISVGSGQFDEEVEQDAAVETSLDVDMVSAACPACHILVLQGDDFIASGDPTFDQKGTAYATAYTTAVRLGANVVSLSDMFGDTPNLDGPIGAMFDHPGVPLFASIGDVAGDAAESVKAADDTEEAGWPHDLPWVVSVGGTKLTPTDASRTAFTETAWPGLAGDCDNVLLAAPWQPKALTADCTGHRAGADISAIADPSSGPAVYDSYAPFTGVPMDWIVSGGTSASAPFVAAWYARGEHTTTAHGPSRLYQVPPATFHDVTSGGAPADLCAGLSWPTVLCQAGPGWDGPTGVGSPHGLGWF
jgi:subtilase family serine protease